MKNIILIGMPGTGKSVVGQALAQRMNYQFVDVDDLIVRAAGQTLAEILRSRGLDAFLALEGQIGEALTCENTVTLGNEDIETSESDSMRARATNMRPFGSTWRSLKFLATPFANKFHLLYLHSLDKIR